MKNSLLAFVSVAGLLACGNNAPGKPTAARDAAPSGSGAAGAGGPMATGGTVGTGGFGTEPSAGGASGGRSGTGAAGPDGGGGSDDRGTIGAGGTTGVGGGTGTGGAGTTAGTPDTGGATATVGAGGSVVAGTGGTKGTGGASATGGSKGTGGASATGGTKGTGGVAGRGGMAGTWSAGPAETKPTGYGQSTTGCGSGATATVDSLAAAQAAIDAYAGSGGLCIKYTGRFDFASITDPCTQHSLPAQTLELKRVHDVTLLGADGSGANFGVHIASSSSNIVVRNMRFGLLPGGGASDAISVEGMSGGAPTNIWIDHNELWSSMIECAGAGDTSFDGLIDLKKGADNVTVSYNYLHDHHKVSLNGYSDDDTAIRHITFHHNVFDNVGSRTPLQRGGYSHVLNNYFHRVTTSGANIRTNGYTLIEGNYFDTVENPVTSRDSSAIGYWELRKNNITSPADFTTLGITWSPSTSAPSVDATDWQTTAAFPVALPYSYTADPPACLPGGLPHVAGAGTGLATLKCN